MDNKNNQIEIEREGLMKEAKSFEKSPWIFLIRKSKLTYLIIIFLLIFGLATIESLPRELNPEVEIPFAVVLTVYPGASPIDVEEQITKEIEAQISEIEGIKTIESTSSLGVSTVTVEFEADQDLEDSIRKVKDEVSIVESELPEDATTPRVIEVSVSSDPILVATLSGENYDLSDLKRFGDNIQDRIKNIAYVSDVRVLGGRDQVVRVDVNQDRLAEIGLNITDVVTALELNNFDFPAGSIELGVLQYSVRVSGKFADARQIAKLPIAYDEGKPILLEDVAAVQDGFSKRTSISRLSFEGSEPAEAVSIQVFKKTGGDVTRVTREVRAGIEQGIGRDYPEDVSVEVTRDFSVYIVDSINTLSSNGLGTVLIILALLFFFMGWREALIAGLAVPFSFFISFIMMSIIGESLNFLSLFALVLALGLLVDSAIVIVEGMFTKVAKFSLSGYHAAILTIKEYAAPLLSGMLTTVAAFFPLIFVKGIFGEFLKVIPIVVNTTLIAALFVALTIVPAIGALLIKPHRKKQLEVRFSDKGLWGRICSYFKLFCKSKPRSDRISTKLFRKLAGFYNSIIPEILTSKRRRRKLLIGIWTLFLISIILPFTGLLKIEAFATPDSEFFFINVEAPNGTVLEETDKAVAKIDDILRKEPEVVNFVSTTGTSVDITSFAGSSGGAPTNKAFIEVNLTDADDREAKSTEIVGRVRRQIEENVTNAEVIITEAEGGPPAGAPVEARVEGEDLLILGEIAGQIKNQLEQIPTVIDIETSLEESSGELVFVPNKDVTTSYGITVAQIAIELRNGIARNTDVEITIEGDEIDVNVGYNENLLRTVDDLRAIQIRSTSGQFVSISELGDLNLEPALSAINRKDQERVVTVTANTDGGNPTEITNELQERVQENVTINPGYNVFYGGETQELMETYQDMLVKMVIGIILILFILVIQFNSYKQVLIILFTIPLAMIGVIWGMTLARLTIDIPAFIGIVSLSGIVVNNAIILIDQINKEIKRGAGLVEAAQHAGFVRLRPIILTTITTVFGLLPLSITQPDWRNMGFTIIFGLLFSTFLTLVIVPTLFVSFYRKKFGIN